MKKVFYLLIILSMSCCYAETINNETYNPESQEIMLDLKTPQKTYNLQKNNNFNNPKIEPEYDMDEMPFDIITTPLQILKQYQKDNF